jgi:hypothetical protein
MRTLAPRVMSACACANWVASLPSAFWMLYFEAGRPAVLKARFRYGASKRTYRLELTVSGSSTSTEPRPTLMSGLSFFMALKLLLKSLTEIFTVVELVAAWATAPAPGAG